MNDDDKPMTLGRHLSDRSNAILWALIISMLVGSFLGGWREILVTFLVLVFFIIG